MVSISGSQSSRSQSSWSQSSWSQSSWAQSSGHRIVLIISLSTFLHHGNSVHFFPNTVYLGRRNRRPPLTTTAKPFSEIPTPLVNERFLFLFHVRLPGSERGAAHDDKLGAGRRLRIRARSLPGRRQLREPRGQDELRESEVSRPNHRELFIRNVRKKGDSSVTKVLEH